MKKASRKQEERREIFLHVRKKRRKERSREEWTRVGSKEELVEKMTIALATVVIGGLIISTVLTLLWKRTTKKSLQGHGGSSSNRLMRQLHHRDLLRGPAMCNPENDTPRRNPVVHHVDSCKSSPFKKETDLIAGIEPVDRCREIRGCLLVVFRSESEDEASPLLHNARDFS